MRYIVYLALIGAVIAVLYPLLLNVGVWIRNKVRDLHDDSELELYISELDKELGNTESNINPGEEESAWEKTFEERHK